MDFHFGRHGASFIQDEAGQLAVRRRLELHGFPHNPDHTRLLIALARSHAALIHYLKTCASQWRFSMPLSYTTPHFSVSDGNLATGMRALTVDKDEDVGGR